MAPVDLDAEKKSRVFLVYDDAMLAHAHIPHLQKKHPEKPSRITTIHDLLRELGLLERCDCESVKPRAATDEEILLVHTEEHLAEVRQITADVAKAPLNRELREPDGPGGIYYSPESLRAALLAAGCVIQMCDQILQLHEHETAAAQAPTSKGGARSPVPESGGSAAGAAPNGSPIASGARGVSASNAKAEARMPPSALALVRPPGHHAGYDDTPGHRAEGFCFFNSVACAARAAIASRRAERVLVLDYDVHHGNGTEKLFWEARDVLYMSIHRCARAPRSCSLAPTPRACAPCPSVWPSPWACHASRPPSAHGPALPCRAAPRAHAAPRARCGLPRSGATRLRPFPRLRLPRAAPALPRRPQVRAQLLSGDWSDGGRG